MDIPKLTAAELEDYGNDLWSEYCGSLRDTHDYPNTDSYTLWLVKAIYTRNYRIAKLQDHVTTHANIRTN